MMQNTLSSLIKTLLFCAASALMLVPGMARASSIGVNFSDTQSLLSASDYAGASPYIQNNWNNVTSLPNNLLLKDNSGQITTTALTITDSVSFGLTTTTASPDELLNSERANCSSASSWSFTLSNISFANYSIVVYEIDHTGVVKAITIGALSYYSSAPSYMSAGYLDNNAATPYIYTLASSTNSLTPTLNSDFVVFSRLTGSTQTITITSLSGAGNERVGGFQIVEAEAVPEPAAFALLGLGAVGWGILRRKNARK